MTPSGDTICRRRSTCRICASRDLELVLPLAPTPIASEFRPKPEALPSYPLDVALCRRCGLVQLLDTVDPTVLYQTATERTARDSPGMAQHFKSYAQEVAKLAPGGFAVEIGSNDGCLLAALHSQGLHVLGIDPAKDAAADTKAAGYETWPCFFTASVAKTIRESHGRADVIVANNVLANMDNLPDVAEGIKTLLSPSGFFVFETGYLGSLVEHLVFDNIYHEHLSYFSVFALMDLFATHGLELFDVEVVNTKGGSLRGYVQHYHGPRPHTTAVVERLTQEEQQGLVDPATYLKMGAKLSRIKETLCDLLASFDKRDRALAGYGASHSCVTLLHHLDLLRWFRFVIDDNPVKQGLFLPGGLPIFDPSWLEGNKYAVILPWRFADLIIAKNQDYQKAGGRFIVPIPEVRIV